MLNRTLNVRATGVLFVTIVALLTAACQGLDLPFLSSGAGLTPETATAVSDSNGAARVSTPSRVYDFQVTSGLSGERLPGVQITVAEAGRISMVHAVDSVGQHLPIAVPLTGESNVRRLVMPPATGLGYNITTASGPLDIDRLTQLGTLTEAELHQQLRSAGDEAVLLYQYNPAQPLALTGASLQAFATLFDDVIILRPGIQDESVSHGWVVGLVKRRRI